MNRLYVVGIGPGKQEGMTMEAHEALTRADVIAGYSRYVELVRPLYPGKEVLVTGMRRETERCALALAAAAGGKTVALVCSGDAGVYGMAGLICTLAPEYPDVEIELVPGVTAALSGAALLGAPLAHDFAVISLSDLLTPWELIEKRLRCAATGDFCICLYNPSSHGRSGYLKRACEVLLETLSPETVCGFARNIGREGERAFLAPLGGLGELGADMFTTVFIGNSRTKVLCGRMVTPRGYRDV